MLLLSSPSVIIVIPAKAGISLRLFARLHQEVPAFAGMTTFRGDDNLSRG